MAGPRVVIGRDVELVPLCDALRKAASGAGSAVLIEGEPGIGKSALISAAAAGVTADPDTPIDVVYIESAELLGRVPRSLAVWADRPVAETRQGRRSDAVDLMSDLTRAARDPTHALDQGLQEIAERIWKHDPVAVVFENLQEADDAALALWHRLIATSRCAPLVLIGTRRPVPACPALDRQRRDLAGADGLVLALGPLIEPDVAEMARALTGARPGSEFGELLSAAAGNPRYVREIVRECMDSGTLLISGGVAELRPNAPPPSFGWVEDHLGFLRPETLSALRGAALLEPPFSAADLALVTARTPADLIPAVDEALASRVVEPVGPLLRFRHPVIRASLRAATPPEDRAAIIQRATRALIEAGAHPRRIVPLLLSAQGAGTGTEPWAADWLADNANALIHQLPGDAAVLFTRAVADLAADDPRHAVLEDALATVSVQLLRLDDGIRLTRAITRHSTDPDRVARNTFLLGLSLLMKLDSADEMARVLQQAADRPEISGLWRARFDALRASGYAVHGQYAQAQHAAEQALGTGWRLNDATTLGYALHARAAVALAADRDSRASAFALAQALAVTRADPGVADLHFWLWGRRLSIGLEIGLPAEELMSSARRVLATAIASGAWYQGSLRVHFAELAYELGLWDEAATALTSDDQLLVPQARQAVTARIAARSGRWSEAADNLARLRGFTAKPGTSLQPIVYRHVLAARALEQERYGSPADAAAMLFEFVEPGAEQRNPQRHRFLPALARYAIEAGDRSTAATAARAAEADCRREPLIGKRVVEAWCRGLVQSDPDAIAVAAALLRRSGARSDLGNALEDAAASHAEQGDTEKARLALIDSLDVYTDLGARWDARRATARLRARGVRLTAKDRRGREGQGARALTATEMRVAELVAEGHTNPDIADRLNISRRTVDGHVSQILNKLGADSRYEVRSHLTPQRAAGP